MLLISGKKLNSMQNTYQYHLWQTRLHLQLCPYIFVSIIRNLVTLFSSVSSASWLVNLLQGLMRVISIWAIPIWKKRRKKLWHFPLSREKNVGIARALSPLLLPLWTVGKVKSSSKIIGSKDLQELWNIWHQHLLSPLAVFLQGLHSR